MAKPSESKKPLEDNDATYKASNSSEQNDEVLNPDPDSDLEAGEKSPSTDNDTGNNETASWKEMRAIAPLGSGFYRRRVVFWNGAIHWMNSSYIHVRFDIHAENLTGTPMPKVPNILKEDKIQYFGECGGSLLLIQSREDSAMGFRILEMKKDCYRWFAKCKVNLRPICNTFPEGYRLVYRVLSCVNGANEKDFTLVFMFPGKVIAYNQNCKTMKVLLDLQGDSHPPPGYSYRNTYQFIESLFPL